MCIKFSFRKEQPSAETDQRMTVVLGGLTIKAYVAAPHGYNVIGIVRIGMEFGLLATTQHGNYVRVNGSEIQPLFKSDVREAMQLAKLKGRGESYYESRVAELPATPAPVPTVLLKKHRKIDPELAANNSQLQSLAA